MCSQPKSIFIVLRPKHGVPNTESIYSVKNQTLTTKHSLFIVFSKKHCVYLQCSETNMASIYSVLIQTWRVYNVRNQTWTVLIVSRAKHRLLIVLRAKHGVVYLYFSVPNMECVCCYEPNMSTIYSVTSQTCHLFIKSQTCLFKVLRTKR